MTTTLNINTNTANSNHVLNTSNNLIGTPDSNKKYALVKWLENSHFDVHNEWVGRLTSVQHSNIIDFDAAELKAGMEISVFRNGGEIWRAQVIIPKTSSNTIDLPPSSHKRIRTKAMGTSSVQNMNNTSNMIKFTDTLQNSTSPPTLTLSSSSSDQLSNIDLSKNITKTFVDLNDFNELNESSLHRIKTEASTPNLSSINHNLQTGRSDIVSSNKRTSPSPDSYVSRLQNNKANINKELQFLQTAISEAGLTDFYQTFNHQSTTPTISSINCPNSATSNKPNIIQVNDVNLETILQMQCQLLDQQKELKSIELETMEQLRRLHENINRLSRKFDSFQVIVSDQIFNNSTQHHIHYNQSMSNINNHNFNILQNPNMHIFNNSIRTNGGLMSETNTNNQSIFCSSSKKNSENHNSKLNITNNQSVLDETHKK